MNALLTWLESLSTKGVGELTQLKVDVDKALDAAIALATIIESMGGASTTSGTPRYNSPSPPPYPSQPGSVPVTEIETPAESATETGEVNPAGQAL